MIIGCPVNRIIRLSEESTTCLIDVKAKYILSLLASLFVNDHDIFQKNIYQSIFA